MILQHLFKILLFILSLSFTTFTQNKYVKSFDVKGNRIFSQKEYLQWSGIKINQQIFNGFSDTISANILKSLSAENFYFAKINSIDLVDLDSINVAIIVNVEEDSPTIISSIDFELDDTTEAKFFESQFSPILGQSLTKYKFEEVVNNILNYFENNGYPFISIIIQSILFDLDTLNNRRNAKLFLKIDKGVFSKIDLIEILGNTSTKEYVILRELRFSEGELYSQKKINEIPNRLNRLRFFEPIKIPTFYINKKEQGVLVIEVKEKQTNNFDGLIGYVPPTNQQGKGFLTGLLNLSLRNLFGTGRALAFRWNKFDEFSQELELKYLEPWFFNFPFNIEFKIYQRIQDTTFVQRNFQTNIEYLATEALSFSLIVNSEFVIPTERKLPVFTVFNSSLFTTGLNFKYDSRDDPYSPTKGILFSNTYLLTRKIILGPKEFITPSTELKLNFQRIISDLQLYYQLFSKQVAAISFHARELNGKFFENSELFKLGGLHSLRGYREEQFLGNRLFWSNIEYRFLLTPRSFVFAFFDIGYYQRNADPIKLIQKKENLLYGYGVGLNIESGIGLLAIRFALGKDDAFSDGKIHFGIVSEF